MILAGSAVPVADAQWQSKVDARSAVSVELVVRANMDAFGTLVNEDFAVWSDQVAPVHGTPISTLLGEICFFPVLVRIP
jgi:hypothetical protein